MQIVPMRDLKNTVEIERKCEKEDGPVFITKNGYGCLVVMNMDYYERTMGQIEEAALVNRGIRDYENGKTVDGKQAIAILRKKHGV